ncbi:MULTISPECIES: HAD hydrolase family protein [unclassified Granulicatella]|uniref:HAD hydrolase family protein n=1 Tax=unclassified Granulicatella TaxID=2630493 RepID=UPI001073E556|nr:MULTISPECIES: HAD family hydrolase [unclassified Granulicatella]MBF0781039.1 HAD family phosphatase [Granulicatella sp. 19428wC4_WM01]TFU92453.1 HAD family phosphatase [Granulicatella sp. WM01]
MIKLFATDLDGTFLNHLHRSDKWSERAVKETLAQRKHFAIATGRHLHPNHRVGLKFIDEPIYKVCMNGALVLTPSNHIISEQRIDNVFIQLLNQTFPDIAFEYVTRRGVYISRSNWKHFVKLNSDKLIFKYVIKHVIAFFTGNFKHISECQEPILKIDCYVGNSERANDLCTFLHQHTNKCHNAGPNKHHFELTAAHVNKQTGLMHVLADLHLSENEVAVYGNDRNDLEMLTYFKESFAPSNAIVSVKQVVKEVLDSNKHNGVAKHILQTLKYNKHN